MLTPTDRPPLKLLVRDSGRTWLISYDKIKRIPPDTIELGDVLIVRHPTETGVMAMQVTRTHKNAWHFDALEFASPDP